MIMPDVTRQLSIWTPEIGSALKSGEVPSSTAGCV